MALKKSQLYSSLWQSCDELRGGMDASQYKDYVLTLLFMKYVSDKHAGHPDALIDVPKGGGFADIAQLKGDIEIGDRINKIIGQLAEENDLKGVIDQADFNDESKLGAGKEMQDRLSKLVAIFEGLDLRANRTEGDDLLGDAYEYLMRHFATESGKSKGQFYTPAEVSRVMARVVGIGVNTSQDQTIYDPTCGSGSLLLKAAAEAPRGITIYGQEMDNATWALARMNMILHGHPTAELVSGNTLAAPYFKNKDGSLKTFDFAVANPPFSAKAWSNGLNPEHDEFGRFAFGIPPTRNGDYAFLLHFIASLKSKGKGAIILPHGVLFRGNREATIRRKLIQRGFIRGIIGLPPNLFYGTGIPACILVLDKENAYTHTGVFMIDASKRFLKDGNKNRLRPQDIHQIVDVFTRQTGVPHYSRLVPLVEIGSPANQFNLNIPRYIDSSEPEDLHDLGAHLHGGIPNRDIDALGKYWDVFPSVRPALFADNGRAGYSDTRIDPREVKATILENGKFQSYSVLVKEVLEGWCRTHEVCLLEVDTATEPQALIRALSEDLLGCFAGIPLLDPYDVYQLLMDYWDETMQDDVYLVLSDGWESGRRLRIAYDDEIPDFVVKKGQKTTKYVGELIPASLVTSKFLGNDRKQLAILESELDILAQRKKDFEKEHSTDEGTLCGLEGKNSITKENLSQRVMELKASILRGYPEGSTEYILANSVKKTTFGKSNWTKNVRDEDGLFEELDVLHDYLTIVEMESKQKAIYKQELAKYHASLIENYKRLTVAEIRKLVIEDKWLASIRTAVNAEVQSIAQRLDSRIQEIEQRYSRPLPELERDIEVFSAKVADHLARMRLSSRAGHSTLDCTSNCAS